MQLIKPRSAGVEAIDLAAMDWLGIDPILADLGLNGIQRAAVAGSLIERMAAPGSDLRDLAMARRTQRASANSSV